MMIKKITTVVVGAVLCLSFWASGQSLQAVKQQQKVTKALEIGERVPPEFWQFKHQMYVGGKLMELDLSTYKGKPLILDFWATWCGPCIGMMPKLDSLQEHYQGKVNILAVGYQGAKEQLPVLQQRLGAKSTSINSVIGDSRLQGYFPYRELPHYVWIDRDGIVNVTTGPKEINAPNIEKLLNEGALQVEIKKDVIVSYDRSTPLFSYPEFAKRIRQQSTLGGYVEGIAGGFNRSTLKNDQTQILKISMHNASISSLYALAYGYGKEIIGKNRIQLKVANTEALATTKEDNALKAWQKHNTYSYELLLVDSLQAQAWEIMIADLERYFPKYKAQFELKKVKCYALVQTDAYKSVATKGGQTQVKIDRGSVLIRNKVLARFIAEMNLLYQQYSPYPLVDASGIIEPVDLDLQCNLSNLEEVNSALAPYGLEFKEQYHRIPILTISDRKR